MSKTGSFLVLLLSLILLFDWLLCIRPLQREDAIVTATHVRFTRTEFLKHAPRPTAVTDNEIIYRMHRFEVSPATDIIGSILLRGEFPLWGTVEITVKFGGTPSVIQSADYEAYFSRGAMFSGSSGTWEPYIDSEATSPTN